MANTLKLKRSSVALKVPVTTDLQLGEMALNTNDGRLFTKKNVSATDYIVEFLSTDSAFKTAVAAATTANITLSATQTIDGIACAVGDRVLVKNQTAPAENGIYIVQSSTWTRATDMDLAADCAGAIVGVKSGTTNGGSIWYTGFKASDALGTTGMTWSQLGSASAGVSSISFGTTGLTPNTATTGAITVAGTLAVANGGTGQTSGQAALTALQGYLAITSSASAVTLTASSPRTIYVSGSSAQTIILPDVSTLQLGWTYRIINANSAGAVTVQSSGLNSFSAVHNPNQMAEYTVILTTGTTTASWVQTFTGSTGKQGFGSIVYNGAPAIQQINYITSNAVTAGTNAQGQGALTETVNIVTTAANNPSGVTLPTSSAANWCRQIHIINRGANPVNVYPASGGTIDTLAANAPVSIPVGGFMTFWNSSTTQWWSSTLTLEAMPGAWIKKAVIAATTANVTLTGGAPNTVDGVTLAANDRVLVKNQTAPAENGIYRVATLGTGADGTWTRVTGADTAADIAGATVSVDRGTVNAGQIWTTYFKDTDTLGTTAMPWYRIVDTSQDAVLAITSSASTATLTATSPRTIYVTGTAAQTIVLPDVSTLPLGWKYRIINGIAQNNITVQSSGLNSFAIPVGIKMIVEYTVVSTTGTTTASWLQTFAGSTGRQGVGALLYDTYPLVNGFQLYSSNAITAGTNAQGQGALTESMNVITTAANNPSGVTLPSPLAATQCMPITIVNRGANPVNVYPASGHTIDNNAANASISLPVGATITFRNLTATQWWSEISYGKLIRAPQIITSGTSYTTPANCTYIYAEAWGGGGGGGGCPATANTAAPGGGSGGYAAGGFVVTPSTAYTIAIGAGGTGNSNAAGGNGGATTITVGASSLNAGGGTGGANGSATSQAGGVGGTVFAGTYSMNGSSGEHTVTGSRSGRGGIAPMSIGNVGGGGVNGNGGTSGIGNGGSGAQTTTAAAKTGGAGGGGALRIWEYT